MRQFRCDNYALSPSILKKVGQNGYATFSATIARAGVQSYRQPDGSIIKELRHPDDVFKASSISTLRNAPLVTEEDHLKCLVDETPVNSVSEFTMLGVVGSDVQRNDRDEIAGEITVYRPDALKRIDTGEAAELSAGYTVDIVPESGTYKGQKYDQKQVNIIYGHVAAVRQGRAGTAKFRLDSTTAVLSNQETNSIQENSVETIVKKEIPALVIGQGEHVCRLDSLTIEESQDTLAILAQRNKLVSECEKSQSRADKAEGERDQLRTENEELKKELKGSIPASRLDAEAEERAELARICEAYGVDPKGKTNAERKAAVCMAKNPGMDAKRLDGDYLEGAFEPIRMNWKEDAKNRKTLDSVRFSFENGPPAEGDKPIEYKIA